MFKSILNELDKKHKGKIKSFIYYLDRHIGLDENEHTPAALKMVKSFVKTMKRSGLKQLMQQDQNASANYFLGWYFIWK